MPRPLIPPRGVFVPSGLLFDHDRPKSEWLHPVVRDTAIQIMALAWGKNETPPISFDELSKLTGKSMPTLYAHMGLLRDRGALRWRPSGTSTIIVELLDGTGVSENLEMPDPLNHSELNSIKKDRIKNSDSENSESSKNPESAPRARDPMFDAIVAVTRVDPSIKSAAVSVGKARRELLQAKPPYTAEEVLAFGVWWNGDDWRRKNGPPACHNITQKIGVIRNGNGQSASSEPHVSVAERAIQISQARRKANGG